VSGFLGVARRYNVDIVLTVVVGTLLTIYKGPEVLPLFLILLIVEISLSGDNAVVNVDLLKLMSPLWVMLFTTVGILIAAGFMRFVFPILIVAFSTGLDFGSALSLSLNDHVRYSASILDNESVIHIFGGIYLLLIALSIFSEDPDEGEEKVYWLELFERPLYAILGVFPKLPMVLSGIIIVLSAFDAGDAHRTAVFVAGIISLVINLFVTDLSDWAKAMTARFSANSNVSKAGAIGQLVNFILFMALELQDAAFSFDGVAGGLSITTDPLILAAGLGVGASFVRSATKHLMATDRLADYRYVGVGAGYAILVLAISQLLPTSVHIPGDGYTVGGISAALIIGAALHSHILNQKEGTHESIVDEMHGIDVQPDESVDVSKG
jgi:uncharacterized protein